MKIFFVNGPRSGEELEFALPEITVGREDDNVLRVPAAGVSRYHAKLCRTETGSWIVQDLGSTNGVKVNRVKIDREKELADGDTVEFGDQMIRVSGFGDTAPHLIFNPVGGGGIPAETRQTSALPTGGSSGAGDSAAAPQPEQKGGTGVEDLSALFSSGAGRLFDPKKKERKVESPGREGGAGNEKRRLFSGMFFYVMTGALAVICISAAVLAMSPKNAPKSSSVSPIATGPFSLYFEKSLVSRDNVFRFTLLLEDGRLEFTIDDIKSQRHVSRTEKMSAESIEVFRSRVNSSGIWNEISTPPSPGADESQKRRVMIADGTRVRELSYVGSYAPSSFELLESLISDLAENYGLQTISLTPEELRRQAEQNFAKAEDYYGNREARGSNLRDAIRRYRLVVGALEQFSPRPQLWDRARKRLEEAESLRARKLNNLEVERVRFGQIQDFDAIRNVLLQTMELADEDSREYQTARERLYKLDTWLRGRRR